MNLVNKYFKNSLLFGGILNMDIETGSGSATLYSTNRCTAGTSTDSWFRCGLKEYNSFNKREFK